MCLILHQLQKKATFQSKTCSRSAAFFLLSPPATFTIKGECDKGNAVWCSMQVHTLCLTASWPPVAPTVGTTALPQAGSKSGLGLSSPASAKLLRKSLCCQALFKADQNAKPEALGFHSGFLCQIQCNPCISLPCRIPCLQPASNLTSWGCFVLGGGRDTEGVPQKALWGGKCTVLKTEGKQ